MGRTAPRNGSLGRHPFTTRLLQHVDLDVADLADLDAVIDGELTIRKRRDLIVDGYEYRKLCFVSDGYAVRYKLLPNGKRQILAASRMVSNDELIRSRDDNVASSSISPITARILVVASVVSATVRNVT